MKLNEPSNLHEFRGYNTGTSQPATAVSNASANTKGSWSDIGGTTSFDYNAITLVFSTGSASDYMADIGISDGSNRWNLISDLHLPFPYLANEQTIVLNLPLYVPSGSQLSLRVAGSVGSSTAALLVTGHASGLGGAPGFSKCVTLFTPASSRGIAVDPGGSANTKGSWTEIISSTPESIEAMFGVVGYNGDIARAATASMLLDIGIGSAGNEAVLYPDASFSWGATRDGPQGVKIPVFACDVPSGSRLSSRAQCGIATAGDRTVDLGLYGLC